MDFCPLRFWCFICLLERDVFLLPKLEVVGTDSTVIEFAFLRRFFHSGLQMLSRLLRCIYSKFPVEHMFHPFVYRWLEPVLPKKTVSIWWIYHNNSIFFLCAKSFNCICLNSIWSATPALMAFCLAISIIELSISAPRISSWSSVRILS